jgi:peptidoglycan L-alanyl-D-glutamate endopeptidase CwlK
MAIKGRDKLDGVHPDLVALVERTGDLYHGDFMVTEGLRTLARQKKLKEQKRSKTLNSRHLTGHAVDLAPIIDGDIPWQDAKQWIPLANAMKQAAKEAGVKIVWGGSWGWDSPHFELDRKQYPATDPTGEKPYKPKVALQSRTVQGSAVAGAGGLGLMGDAAMSLEEAQDHLSAGTIVGFVLGGVVVAGALWVLWARWDDAGRPLGPFARLFGREV